MTYEYICEHCGHQWEAQQSISEDPLKECPECREPKAKRQISLGGGFILKGGGWYKDLYSSSSGTSSSGASASEASSPKSDSSKSDSAKSTSAKSDAGAGSSSSGSSDGSSTAA